MEAPVGQKIATQVPRATIAHLRERFEKEPRGRKKLPQNYDALFADIQNLGLSLTAIGKRYGVTCEGMSVCYEKHFAGVEGLPATAQERRRLCSQKKREALLEKQRQREASLGDLDEETRAVAKHTAKLGFRVNHVPPEIRQRVAPYLRKSVFLTNGKLCCVRVLRSAICTTEGHYYARTRYAERSLRKIAFFIFLIRARQHPRHTYIAPAEFVKRSYRHGGGYHINIPHGLYHYRHKKLQPKNTWGPFREAWHLIKN